MNGMIRVTISRATDLVERLHAAGVEARILPHHSIDHTLERTDEAFVLFDESTDPAAVNRVVSEFKRDFVASKSSKSCPECEYDLSGHLGVGTCPECGAEVNAETPDVPCDTCGEEVPLHFEVCWNCDSEMDETEPQA